MTHRHPANRKTGSPFVPPGETNFWNWPLWPKDYWDGRWHVWKPLHINPLKPPVDLALYISSNIYGYHVYRYWFFYASCHFDSQHTIGTIDGSLRAQNIHDHQTQLINELVNWLIHSFNSGTIHTWSIFFIAIHMFCRQSTHSPFILSYSFTYSVVHSRNLYWKTYSIPVRSCIDACYVWLSIILF